MNQIGQLIDGSSAAEAANILNSLRINPDLAKDILTDASSIGLVTSSAEELESALSTLNATGSSGISNLGNIFRGLGTEISSLFMTLATNPLTYITIGLAAGAAFLYDYATAFDNAVENAQASQTAYSNTASEISSLNSELETTQARIDELNSKGSLSVTEENELQNLQRQNTELQRQIDLKSKIAASESSQASNDAIQALSLERTTDLTSEYKTVDEFGNTSSSYKNTDIISATENELSKLDELNAQKNLLLAEYNKKDITKDQKSEIETKLASVNRDIETYSSAVSENVQTLNELRNNFIDPTTGNIKFGMDSYYNDITDVIDHFNTTDLFGSEKSIDRIQSFFSSPSLGRNLLSDMLLDMGRVFSLR